MLVAIDFHSKEKIPWKSMATCAMYPLAALDFIYRAYFYEIAFEKAKRVSKSTANFILG